MINCQVDPVSGDDRDFRKMDTAGQRMGFEKAAASAVADIFIRPPLITVLLLFYDNILLI